MIEVKYDINKDKCALYVTGHANSAPKGEDLICASASILALTLAKVIDDSRDKLKKEPCLELKDGTAKIVWTPMRAYAAALYNSFYTIITGYRVLASEYPEYITVEKK